MFRGDGKMRIKMFVLHTCGDPFGAMCQHSTYMFIYLNRFFLFDLSLSMCIVPASSPGGCKQIQAKSNKIKFLSSDWCDICFFCTHRLYQLFAVSFRFRIATGILYIWWNEATNVPNNNISLKKQKHQKQNRNLFFSLFRDWTKPNHSEVKRYHFAW